MKKLIQLSRAVIGALVLCAAFLPTSSSLRAQGSEPSYYFMAFNNPVSGKEDEYNKWYDSQHIYDIVANLGFFNAQRFGLAQERVPAGSSGLFPRYLATYKVHGNFSLAAGPPHPEIAAFDQKTSVSYVYRTVGPEVFGGAAGGDKQSALIFIFAAPVSGKEEELSGWLGKTYIPEMAGRPGLASAQQMVLDRPSRRGIAPTKDLVMFKVGSSDTAAAVASLSDRILRGEAVDKERTRVYAYQAIGPLIEGDTIRASRSDK